MPSRDNSGAVERLYFWSRKLHYYAGLYLLFFVWLFAVSGLVLNHPKWGFASFWPSRKQERFEQKVQFAAGGQDIDQARSLMRQLSISGEVEWASPRQRPGQFEFRVTRPGRMIAVSANTTTGIAAVERISVNAWGVLNMLHSFTGVSRGRPEAVRDWWLTGLWSFFMDAVCCGIVFLVISGYWMWYRTGRRRIAGSIALAAGLIACGLFLSGLG